MKKLLLLLLISTTALADTYRYAGGDIHYSYHKFTRNNYHFVNHITNKPFSGTSPYRGTNFSLYHGWMITDTLSFEYGVSLLKSFDSDQKRMHGNFRTKNAHGQLVFYVPVFNTFKIFVGGGAGILNVEYDDYANEIYFCTQKLSTRVSAGAELPLKANLNLRGSFVWQDYTAHRNHSFKVDNHAHFGLGLNYRFE